LTNPRWLRGNDSNVHRLLQREQSYH